MKKRFSIMAFALVAAFGFTACHDDDDDDDENSATVSNFNQSATIGQSIFDNVTNKANLTTCYFTDGDEIADFYTFSTASVADIAAMGTMNTDGKTCTLNQQGLSLYGEGVDTDEECIDPVYAGGFCPTWFGATDNTPYAPACGKFNNGNGALLCNPRMLLRPFFSRHMALDLTSLMSAIRKLKINSLYVCPSDVYNYIGKSDDDTPYDYEGIAPEALPADHQIQFVVYGYVNSFSINNIQSAISTLKGATSSVANGGTMCANPIVLAETDSNGNLTVSKEWQKMDLTDLKDYYLFEAAIRVYDKTTQKTSEKYAIGTQASVGEETTSSNDYLNYVLVSDVAFTGRSLLGIL